MSRLRPAIVGFAVWIGALTLVLGAASGARAALVTFDDLPAGTVVADQYAPLGVHFGPSPFADQNDKATVVTRAQSHSAPNAGAFAFDAGTEFSSIWMRFDKPQTKVAFFACRTGALGDPPMPNVNVDAYDSNGTQIDNQQGIPCILNGDMVPITVERNNLAYIHVTGIGGATAPGPGWALDDVAFESDPAPQPPLPPQPTPPPSPPPKDFTLRFVDSNRPSPFVVRPGQTVTTKLLVDRNESAFGPIAPSVPPPPPGVHIGFSPSIPSSSSDDEVTMQIVVDAGVQPQLKRVRISAVPQGTTAGANTHTLSFDLLVTGRLAVHTEGIELNQAVQTYAQPKSQTYNGVRLVAQKKTVVRVFADFTGAAAPRARGVARPSFSVALYGVDRNGRALPDSPLTPIFFPSSQALSVNDGGLAEAEQASPSRSFVFVLPPQWTQGQIALTAKALAATPPAPNFEQKELPISDSLCLSFACGATQVRSLGGITFEDPPPVKVISGLEVFYTPGGLLTGKAVSGFEAGSRRLAAAAPAARPPASTSGPRPRTS